MIAIVIGFTIAYLMLAAFGAWVYAAFHYTFLEAMREDRK